MASKATEIARVSEVAWQTAQKMTAALSQLSPPVPLGKLAEQVEIRCVRFAPLIGDAGLARNGSDFEIVVNADAFVGAPSAGTILEVGDRKWAEFPSALRRTIAHEIAHLLFLNAAGKKQDSDLFRKNEEAVENGCNILARVFLLPRNMLPHELGERLLEVDYVNSLLTTFRVSPEVFVRRLHLSDMRLDCKLDGFFAYVQEQEGILRIIACHVVGANSLDRFNSALSKGKSPQEYLSLSDNYKQVRWVMERVIDRKHMPLVDVGLGRNFNASMDIESKLRATERAELDLEVGWGGGDVKPCKLAFVRRHDAPLNLLMSVQVVGSTKKRGQERLL